MTNISFVLNAAAATLQYDAVRQYITKNDK